MFSHELLIMDADTRQLQQLLEQSNCTPDIVLLKHSTTSTNDDVRALAQQGMHTALVCSEIQTQGRGQHQRQWLSPQGNIYLSTLINTETAIDGRLALEVALNLLHMPILKDFNLQIKWPNDLYSHQGKWGGILVEPISAHQAIVGVGINIITPPDLQNLDQAVTSLSELGLHNRSRIELIHDIYVAIQQASTWFNHGCYNLAERFNHVAMFKGQSVSFEHQQGVAEGIFLGIQNDGGIVLDTAQGQTAYYQGRLRPFPSAQ
ncbi:biotin--[acetyl-CoA-carboxylase] ligase [Acinetobacter sp. ANC 4633]|nr:biotin--[acetyl-CoA-carboxylase] ligase [Acinetobacter sp. ANC 4633]